MMIKVLKFGNRKNEKNLKKSQRDLPFINHNNNKKF